MSRRFASFLCTAVVSVFITVSSSLLLAKESEYEDSPFGFHPADPVASALEIGARWNRAEYIHWPRVQRSKTEIENGIFHWNQLDRYLVEQTQAGVKKGVKLS